MMRLFGGFGERAFGCIRRHVAASAGRRRSGPPLPALPADGARQPVRWILRRLGEACALGLRLRRCATACQRFLTPAKRRPRYSSMGNSEAVLLVDHGSRRAPANELLDEVAALVKRRLGAGSIVEPAHMEIAEPTIAQGFTRCVEQGATTVDRASVHARPGPTRDGGPASADHEGCRRRTMVWQSRWPPRSAATPASSMRCWAGANRRFPMASPAKARACLITPLVVSLAGVMRYALGNQDDLTGGFSAAKRVERELGVRQRIGR